MKKWFITNETEFYITINNVICLVNTNIDTAEPTSEIYTNRVNQSALLYCKSYLITEQVGRGCQACSTRDESP